ncbi:hypothetical protein EVA_07870 [gut metagenome]|uniref:Uncharacterized protein n=1 Tax=gut metagenome TaxID=749906 RepID=J9G9R1_9ZZZZ
MIQFFSIHQSILNYRNYKYIDSLKSGQCQAKNSFSFIQILNIQSDNTP